MRAWQGTRSQLPRDAVWRAQIRHRSAIKRRIRAKHVRWTHSARAALAAVHARPLGRAGNALKESLVRETVSAVRATASAASSIVIALPRSLTASPTRRAVHAKPAATVRLARPFVNPGTASNAGAIRTATPRHPTARLREDPASRARVTRLSARASRPELQCATRRPVYASSAPPVRASATRTRAIRRRLA